MYRFYLKQGDIQFLLPVTPSQITTKVGNNNQCSYILNRGEINLLRNIGLQEIQFTILLPHRRLSFVQVEDMFHAPAFFLSKFRLFKESMKPVSLIIFRKLADGTLIFCDNYELVLEDYTVLEQGGEQGDFWLSVRWKEHRTAESIIYSLIQSDDGVMTLTEDGFRRTSKEAASATSYEVKSGDTLWAIAKTHYGDGSRYREIVEKNGITNPNLIYTGQSLVL